MGLALPAFVLLALLAAPAAAVPMRIGSAGGGVWSTLTIAFDRDGIQAPTLHEGHLWEISGRHDAVVNEAILADANAVFAFGPDLGSSVCDTLPTCDPFLLDVFAAEADIGARPGREAAGSEIGGIAPPGSPPGR